MAMTPTQKREFTQLLSELGAALRQMSDSVERMKSATAARKGFTGMSNKAGARGIQYQPMGSMKSAPARDVYLGIDITDVRDPHTRAAVTKALDILHWRGDGALETFAGMKMTTVLASTEKGYWFAAAYPDGNIKFTENMKSLNSSNAVDVVLHELAHVLLRHLEQPRETSAEQWRLETEADSLAMRWRWG